MNLPVLDFPSLWRGTRCARQLRSIIETSACFNPKLCGPDDLQAAGIFPPGLRSGEGAERLDWLFNRQQEQDVHDLAAALFPGVRRIEGDTLWEIEGETLREMGWLGATAGKRQKSLNLHKDNWMDVLPRLPGLADPGFLDRFLWVRPDYLFQETETTWILVMVRSGSRLRDSYIAEAGFIQTVLARKGIQLSQCLLLGANENYLRPSGAAGEAGPINARDFFQLHSLNHSIKHQRQPLIDAIPRILTDAGADRPCDQARTCPLCSQDLPAAPEHSVHTLHRGGKAVDLLEAQGIHDLADIDRADAKARAELKDRHFIQINSIRNGRPHVDRSGLSSFLRTIRFPVLFLDFETTAQALPPAAGIRPWEHVPFMFSAHRAETPADLAPVAEPPALIYLMDPRKSRQEQLPALAASLVSAAEGCASVVVYGGALESHVLLRLGQLLPEHARRFGELRSALVDLQIPFQQFHYYHPRQYGKLSLKKVLPLLSQSSHLDLDLQSGGEANLSFYSMANPQALPPDIGDAFQGDGANARLAALRRYCAMDTWGLVGILSALFALAE